MSARRRTAAVALLACALACGKNKGGSSDELTIVVQGDRRELEQQEKDLKKREDALQDERSRLEQRISELAKGLAQATAEQRRRLDDELLRAREQASDVSARQGVLQAQKSEVEAKRSAIDAQTSQVASAALAAREAGMAAREAKLSERERELAEREKALALGERGLAGREQAAGAREKELASREHTVSSLEQQNNSKELHLDRALREVPKPGVVEAKHKKVLGDLDTRGILITDLPPEDQPLNAEIYAARRVGDLPRAWDLVAELTKVVKNLKVDQRFVEQKMVRLQGARGQARLSEQQRAEVEKLLRDVTSDYSDAKYEQANRGLNRIASILDASAGAG